MALKAIHGVYRGLQSGRNPKHGLILAEQGGTNLGEQGQFLIGLELVEGRGSELPEALIVVADHVHDHAQGLSEKTALGILQDPLAVRGPPHSSLPLSCLSYLAFHPKAH